MSVKVNAHMPHGWVYKDVDGDKIEVGPIDNDGTVAFLVESTEGERAAVHLPLEAVHRLAWLMLGNPIVGEVSA